MTDTKTMATVEKMTAPVEPGQEMDQSCAKWKRVYKNSQPLVASLVSCLGAFSMGVSFGWFVAAREDLEKLNLDRGSLAQVAALNNIGMLVGAVVSPLFNRYLSAHRLIPLLALGSTLSWLPISVPRVPMKEALMIGRVLTGFFTICLGSAVPGYIALVAPDKLKMGLLSAFAIIQNLGQILVIIVGPYLSMQQMSNMFGVVPSLMMVISAFIFPKSEEISHSDEMAKKLNWRMSMANHPILITECKRASVLATNLLAFIEPVSTVNGLNKEDRERRRSTKLSSTLAPFWLANGKCVQPTVEGIPEDQLDLQKLKDLNPSYKRLLLNALPVLFLGSCLALSGTQPWTSYPQDLLPNTGLITPLYLVCWMMGSILSIFVTNRLGRRNVLLVSPIIMAMCTATLSVYYFLNLCSDNAACYIPYACLVVFFISVGVGIGTLTYVLMGDHLLKPGRWITIPLVLFWQNAQYYVLDAVVPEILAVEKWGISTLFAFHTFVNIAAALFVKLTSIK